MENTNCLAGIACPECGSLSRFQITASAVFTVTDHGTEEHEDVEWDDHSHIQCIACGHHGTIAAFRGEAPSSPESTRNRIVVVVKHGTLHEVLADRPDDIRVLMADIDPHYDANTLHAAFAEEEPLHDTDRLTQMYSIWDDGSNP